MNDKLILCDTREKPQAIGKIVSQIEHQGFRIVRTKLYVGDWQLFDNPRLTIDRKQSLLEVASNVCQQHERFIAELERAREIGVHIIILCTHSPNIKSLDDVANWNNPRLATSPKAITGERLAKIMHSIEVRHECEFRFCGKTDAGNEIIRILTGEQHG